MWRNESPPTGLEEMQMAQRLGNTMAVPHSDTCSYPVTQQFHPWGHMQEDENTFMQNFADASSRQNYSEEPNKQKQPACPSADEWMRETW